MFSTRILALWFALLSSAFVLSVAFQSDEFIQDDDSFLHEVGRTHMDEDSFQSARSQSRTRSAPDSPITDSKVHIPLEHAFGGSDFSPAGTFSARLKLSNHGGKTITKLRFSRIVFTEKDKEDFRKLIEDDDFYKIRLPSNILDHQSKEYAVSSVKARCLPQESLDELFVVHVDGVHILAVNYGSLSVCQYPRILRFPKYWSFNSHTVLRSSEQAPRTPLAPSFSEDLSATDNIEGEGIKPIERSFWSKYWMYIIPLVFIIINAFTQAMNYEEQSSTSQAGSQMQQSASQRSSTAAARRR